VVVEPEVADDKGRRDFRPRPNKLTSTAHHSAPLKKERWQVEE